jgi:hypothetical protein
VDSVRAVAFQHRAEEGRREIGDALLDLFGIEAGARDDGDVAPTTCSAASRGVSVRRRRMGEVRLGGLGQRRPVWGADLVHGG